MQKVAAAAGLVVALSGIVGGVAFAAQSQRTEAPMVVVPEGQPVAQTGTPTPTVAASPSAVPVVKAVAPKPAVTSAKPVVKAPAPAPVRQSAPVSSKRTVVKKATTTTSRSFAVAADPTPADPTPAQPAPEPTRPAYNVPRPTMPAGGTEAPNLPNETPTPVAPSN